MARQDMLACCGARRDRAHGGLKRCFSPVDPGCADIQEVSQKIARLSITPPQNVTDPEGHPATETVTLE